MVFPFFSQLDVNARHMLASPIQNAVVNGFMLSSNTVVDKLSFSKQQSHQRTGFTHFLAFAKGQQQGEDEEEELSSSSTPLSSKEIRMAKRKERREKRKAKRMQMGKATDANTEAPVVVTKDEAVDDKFSFGQRIESIKTGVVGLLSGGIAGAPVIALHDLVFADQTIVNNSAQWEFDTDMGSLEAALFAIVYRYCMRDDDNDMLEMGCIGAFVLVQTLSKVRTPTYCLSAPLSCGEPLEYFDWNMLQQAFWSGWESALIFGVAAMAMNSCFEKGYISKFR